MNRQKGQSAVEFALIIPLFLILILGMIYGGFAYADYLQYSTAVREAARDIAVQKEENRAALVAGLNGTNNSTISRYAAPLTKLYNAQFSASIETEEENGNTQRFVKVSVALTLNTEDLGSLIPLPDTLAPLQCTMPIEPEVTVSTQGTDNTSNN